jgi:hypothetical protein
MLVPVSFEDSSSERGLSQVQLCGASRAGENPVSTTRRQHVGRWALLQAADMAGQELSTLVLGNLAVGTEQAADITGQDLAASTCADRNTGFAEN